MNEMEFEGGPDAPIRQWSYNDDQGEEIVQLIDEQTYQTLVRLGRIKPNQQSKPGPIGNTQGLIVPQTSPNTSGSASAPPPSAPAGQEEKGWWKSWGSTTIHGALDVVGLVPIVGEVANGVGALVYVAEGDYASAAMDVAAMWPAGGQAATAAKYGKKAASAAVEQAEKKIAKEVEQKAGEEAEKRATRQAGESAGDSTKVSGGHVKKPPLRQAYEDKVNALSDVAKKKREAGESSEDIAKEMHKMRRDLGVEYKDLTPPKKLAEIYERNINRYGDKLGPSIEWLRDKGKSWDQIIESATRPGGKDLGF